MQQDTSANNKRIAKNTLFMYFRMFFTMCVSLYTSRVVLAVLGFSDYGLYNVVGGVIAMFGFLNGAMSNMTSRFITYYLGQNNYERLSEVFSMAFFIHCGIASLIIILGESIGLWFFYHKMVIPEDRLIAALCIYQFSIASTVMMIISVPFTSDIIAHEKMSVYAYISIVDSVLKLIIVYFLAYAPFDKLIFYGLLLFGIHVLNFLFNLLYCRWHFVESKIHKVWNKNLLKEMSKFTGWSLFGNFSHVFYTQGLNLLLNMFCGPIVNAARGIAVQIEAAMTQFTSNIQTAINPQIIKSYSQDNIQRTKTLIFASSKYCFFLMLLLSLPVMLGADFILGVWLKEYPEHTVNFLRLTLMCVLLDTLVNPMYTANLATGKVAIYNKRLAILSITFIPITYLAIKITHLPEIVFMLNVLRNIIGIGIRMFIIRSQLGIGIHEYCQKVIVRIFVVTAIATLISLFVVHGMGIDSFAKFSLITAISTLSVLMAAFGMGLNHQERSFVITKSKAFILSHINH